MLSLQIILSLITGKVDGGGGRYVRTFVHGNCLLLMLHRKILNSVLFVIGD